MFTEIDGLPVHPLAVHGAVVLVPLAALMGVLFAIPKTRSWSRLPLLLMSLAAVVAVFVARQSGFKIKDHLLATDFPYKNLIAQHQSRAKVLFIIVIIFALVAIAAYVLTRSGDASQSGGDHAVGGARGGRGRDRVPDLPGRRARLEDRLQPRRERRLQQRLIATSQRVRVRSCSVSIGRMPAAV